MNLENVLAEFRLNPNIKNARALRLAILDALERHKLDERIALAYLKELIAWLEQADRGFN